MIAVIFGLVTALSFAVSSLVASRAVRMISQLSVVAWAMTIGAVVAVPVIALGPKDDVAPAQFVRLGFAGVLVVVGLALGWGAFRFGKVAVVTPILACEGAIAAILATLAGEQLTPVAAGLLIVIAIGVVVSAIAPDPHPLDHEEPVKAVLMATGAAFAFGISIFLLGKLSSELPLGWVLIGPRVAGFVLLFLPLLVLRKLEFNKRVVPYLLVLGISELIGYVGLYFGSKVSVAVTAVVASQTALIAGLLAYFLFRERLGKWQLIAAGVLLVSVSSLAWVMG